MILKKIMMENFRQFKGRQTIDFSSSSPGITIVYGENGRGKTGIFRALMFGLYGERQLPQDEGINVATIKLVNMQCLTESEGSAVNASVTVCIQDDGKEYNITRKVIGIKSGAEIAEESAGASMVVTDAGGNTEPTITDPSEIGETVGRILDPKIKDYFLFDGEKIERLTRADDKQKRVVASGIKNLLSINELDTAKHGLELLCERLDAQLDTQSQGLLTLILKRVNENDESIRKLKAEREMSQSNLDQAEEELQHINAELQGIKGLEGAIARRQILGAQEKQILEDQMAISKYVISHLGDLAQALVVDKIQKIYSYLDSKKVEGEIPKTDKLVLIEKILHDHTCICGADVVRGSAAYKAIIEWKNKINRTSLDDAALDIWRDTNSIIGKNVKTITELQENLAQYEKKRQILNSIQQELKTISQTIDDGKIEEAKALNKARDQAIGDIARYKLEIQNKDEQRQECENLRLELAQKRDDAVAQEGLKTDIQRATKLAQEARSLLTDIFESYTTEKKNEIAKLASKIMEQLLDKEGRTNLKDIVVNSDYSLQVTSSEGKPFLANISAGQRQIISLCFITALAQVASGKERFEIPLFMDTPFGRLSRDHRINLIRFIPAICRQWVTLVTDTEFTQTEWESYKPVMKGCRFYKLCTQVDGTTRIRSIPNGAVPQEIAAKGVVA